MTCVVYAVPPTKMDALRQDPGTEVAAIVNAGENALPNAGLEKSWHALHFLLTGSADFDTPGPLAFLLAGGESIGSDLGFGGQLFTPPEAKEIDADLAGLADDELWGRYDAAALESAGVYPMIWDEPEDDLRAEYLSYFHELKGVVGAAAAGGMGLLVIVM